MVISRNFLYDGGAFEHIFCPGGEEFEKPDFKKFKFPASARGGGGGMLKFRIDRYITLMHWIQMNCLFQIFYAYAQLMGHVYFN